MRLPEHIEKLSSVVNFHTNLIKNMNKKVGLKKRKPTVMSIFNVLPKKHFVLSKDNRGQLYKEAINFLYDENLRM